MASDSNMNDDSNTAAGPEQELSYFLQSRQEILPFVPTQCRTLLDIGCGGGAFGALVKKSFGAEVWGVDISPVAAELARAQLDHVVNAPFDANASLPDRFFDVITFNDSLEHFPDPYPALALCKHKLADNGLVVCCLPNVRYIENVRHFLVEMDWKYEDAGILDKTHLRFFTRKSMLRTFDEAGYDVLSITGIRPHYWSGKRIFLLRLLFDRWMTDMKYIQYVIVARPR